MSAELPLIAKDARALIEELVASHGDQLRRFLLARVRNTVDVQDIIQEVYLRMLRVPNAESVRSPEAYLFTVAQHVLQQHTLKSAALPISGLEEIFNKRALSADPDPALELAAAQSLDGLQATLDELSPKMRAVFLLSRLEGLSFDEIATCLGVSKPMVKKYLAKALLRLRQKLEQAD